MRRERLAAECEKTGRIYIYYPESRMWHHSLNAQQHRYASDQEDLPHHADAPTGAAHTFGQVSSDEVYEYMSLLEPADGRSLAGKHLKRSLSQQMRRVGEVLTCAEMGLYSSRLPHRAPLGEKTRILMVARSNRKRWTALYAYPESSTTHRSVARWLRSTEQLSSARDGYVLKVQHQRRTVLVEDEPTKIRLVEARYVADHPTVGRMALPSASDVGGESL